LNNAAADVRRLPCCMNFDRPLMLLAALLGVIGVAAGTFGAHGLAGRVTPEMLETFETGVRYQLFHAVALIAIAVAVGSAPGRLMRAAGLTMAVGALIFSCSLYALVLTDQRWLGMITPVGGVGFLVGWGLLAVAALRR
jgi:uncharacterized membrane protein YgdD (TMEM256/DUF423 family)